MTIKNLPAAHGTAELLSTDSGILVSDSELTLTSGLTLPLPDLDLYADESDTWSHGLDRYPEEHVAKAQWDKPKVFDTGPLMASWIRLGTIGQSKLSAEWRVYSNGFAELKLKVDWREQHKLLKLVQPLRGKAVRRTDGVLGGWIERLFDGRELPLRDGMLIEVQTEGDTAAAWRLGIVAPDVYAADATPSRLRFTLLRSAVMAHHEPVINSIQRRVFSDQGDHTFTFRYFVGAEADTALLDMHATAMQRPLIMADLTRGMPLRLYDLPLVPQA